jgi:hypothetical protein
VEEQKTLSLECETSHSISTKWFHNGKEISGMDHREIIQEGRLHRLVINKTTPHDAGIYKCTVKNQTTESKVTVKGIMLEKRHVINSVSLSQYATLLEIWKVLRPYDLGEQTHICAFRNNDIL